MSSGVWWPHEGVTAPGGHEDLSFLSSPGGKHISRYRVVLGPQQPSHPLELPGGQHSVDFYVEGLAFPDVSFPGLISLTVSLLDTSNPVGQEETRAPGPWPTSWVGGWGGYRALPGSGRYRSPAVVTALASPTPSGSSRRPAFPRQRGLPCGPLDYDPEHSAPRGGVRVQVRVPGGAQMHQQVPWLLATAPTPDPKYLLFKWGKMTPTATCRRLLANLE